MAMNPLSLIPVFGGLFGESSDVADRLSAEDLAALEAISAPSYRVQAFNPEEFTATQVSESPELRNRQLALLDMLQGNAERGLSESDAASYELATQRAQQGARQRDEALIANAQARGVGGSGVELALRQQAGQDAMNRAQEANLQKTADSARTRAAYLNAYGNQAGDVRGTDLDLASKNAEIMNRFNQLNTAARNQANEANITRREQMDRSRYADAMDMARAKSAARSGQLSAAQMRDSAAGGVRGRFEGLASGLAGAAFSPGSFGSNIGSQLMGGAKKKPEEEY